MTRQMLPAFLLCLAAAAPVFAAERVGAIPVSDILAAEDNVADLSLGGSIIELTIGVAADGETLVKLLHAGQQVSVRNSRLGGGADAALPHDTRLHLVLAGDTLTITTPGAPGVTLTMSELLQRAYRNAVHFRAGSAEFAVLLEGSKDAPGAVSILRRDAAGGIQIQAFSAADVRAIKTFATVQGVDYGIRLEGDELAIYSGRR